MLVSERGEKKEIEKNPQSPKGEMYSLLSEPTGKPAMEIIPFQLPKTHRTMFCPSSFCSKLFLSGDLKYINSHLDVIDW